MEMNAVSDPFVDENYMLLSAVDVNILPVIFLYPLFSRIGDSIMEILTLSQYFPV